MTRITQLRQSRNSYSTALLKFTRIFAKKTECLICIFEGNDSKYYGIRITEIVGTTNWESISCGGKFHVLKLHQTISRNVQYRKALVAYFIDRDFDTSLPKRTKQHLYETPCYSVENFYSTKSCFMRILKAEFGLDEYDDKDNSFKKCIEVFECTQGKFHRAISLLNAWIMTQRRKNQNHSTLNLNNVSLDKLIKVDLDNVEKRYNFEKLSKLFPEAETINETEVDSKVSEFHKRKSEYLVKIFRGKYEIEFLRIIIMKLIEDRSSRRPRYISCGGKTRLSISKTNIISELSQYADTPDCLREYLKQFQNNKSIRQRA